MYPIQLSVEHSTTCYLLLQSQTREVGDLPFRVAMYQDLFLVKSPTLLYNIASSKPKEVHGQKRKPMKIARIGWAWQTDPALVLPILQNMLYFSGKNACLNGEPKHFEIHTIKYLSLACTIPEITGLLARRMQNSSSFSKIGYLSPEMSCRDDTGNSVYHIVTF